MFGELILSIYLCIELYVKWKMSCNEGKVEYFKLGAILCLPPPPPPIPIPIPK